MAPIVVTSALPYSNDRLHLGHLRSTYLPPDVFVRYLRRKGEDVIFICATDEHGTPIALRAEKEHVDPKDITDRYHPVIKEDLERMGCSFDYFSRTTDQIHYEMTQHVFNVLFEKGYIYEQEIELLRCPKCNKYLPDRYVEGTCPFCGYEGARGDSCDSCGRYLRITELKDAKCAICGSKPEPTSTKHWFFRLTAFSDLLKAWLEGNNRIPENVRRYALQWINEGLHDWDITRDMRWGVPVPVEGGEGKVVYVWFDAPIGYISSTRAYFNAKGTPEGWKRYWKGEGKIFHFIGKDIIYHHAIFWPAMLMGTGEFNVPEAIIAGEYLTLEGRKMSKSRGWFISIENYLKTFEADPMRYYLISVAPLERDADFSVEDFVKRYNDELADVLGNFIHRTLIFLERFFDSTVPEAELDENDVRVLTSIEKTVTESDSLLRDMRFRDALVSVMNLAREGNRYLNEAAPWATIKASPQRAASALYTSVQIVKALGSLLYPFLPSTSKKIWQMLRIESDLSKLPWEVACEKLPSGHRVGKSFPLFKKIPLQDVQKVKDSLLPRKDVGERVSIEEFKRARIAVGEVVSAERIKGSKDLLHLEVDLGEYGTRSCVAGIAKYYSPDELLHKRVTVLMNVQPATLFGFKSEVMILAAEGEAKVALLVPDRQVPPGSQVR
ncbi:MAG: methionine--tRNA ligase [Candidatus Verstraetearchaeota archaeon]|nr:methionine--tRNA ligase [Candidatus Verstraetearchaeota archaeon]